VAGVVAGLTLLVMVGTDTAMGQGKPACDAQGKAKTAEKVAGQVVKVEPAKVSVRESDGTVHEFQATRETLQDLKVGDHIEARLREAPKCP
jgi:hypothetical protein